MVKNQETNKSLVAEHVLETNYNIEKITHLKEVTKNNKSSIREAIEITKN